VSEVRFSQIKVSQKTDLFPTLLLTVSNRIKVSEMGNSAKKSVGKSKKSKESVGILKMHFDRHTIPVAESPKILRHSADSRLGHQTVRKFYGVTGRKDGYGPYRNGLVASFIRYGYATA
jgi:hypothetical protein